MITTQSEHQELAHLRAEVERLQADSSRAIAALAECIGERDRLRKIVEDFETLVGESSGVYGLHLNGDPSPWSEILQGGRFERIGDIEAALKGGGQ